MKKICVLFTLIMLVLFSSNYCSADNMDFGIHMGTGKSYYCGDIYGINSTYSKDHVNTIGFYLTIPIPNSTIQIQPELNYVVNEFSMSNLLGHPITELNYRFEYLQLPVLLKVNSDMFYETKMFAGIGPYASILLNDSQDIIHRSDYGLLLSAGVTIHETISFEIRHTSGIMDISDINGLCMQNSSNLFLVGFNF